MAGQIIFLMSQETKRDQSCILLSVTQISSENHRAVLGGKALQSACLMNLSITILN